MTDISSDRISNDNARYIDDAVRRGQYQDPSEALNEAIELLKKRDKLRADVHVGIDQANRGELLPADEVFDQLERRAQEIEDAAK